MRPKRSILDRRLLIVTGKGGTGKTTVAAAIALGAAEAGRRVLVVETGRGEHVPPLLGELGPPVGHTGRRTPAGPTVCRMDPYEALAEYLELRLRVPGVARRILANASFRELMNAAPGWRELITLGKVWHLSQEDPASGAGYDLIVVDAPATGHGLTFLDVPRVVVSAVRAGPLRRHAHWVEEMVRDPQHTLLIPVTLAEELPARETVELVERLRSEVGVVLDRVIVNAWQPDPFPEGAPDLDQRLARLDALPGCDLAPAALAHCARHARERHLLNRTWSDQIAEQTGLPLVTLPRLPSVGGPAELRPLAARLLEPEAAG